jgi:hypothetical protein
LRLLLLTPLTLVVATGLLLACLLLLLRLYPLLLRLGAWIAKHRRGATPLVALAQRILDVAAYQAEADFSGAVPLNLYTPQQLNSMTSVYRHLPGVTSATLGVAKPATAGGATLNVPIDFKAVDANAASLLHLSEEANFTLDFSTGSSDLVNFKVVALVQNIPTSGDSSLPGVLVDFQTFADVYTHHFTRAGEFAVPLNYVWLRTSDNATSLSSLRRVLSQGNLQLNPLYDRRQIITTIYHEPLYLTLVGVLALEAVTALLLALVGNLIASWLSARSRLTNFAVLRALGAAPRQIAGVLAWEQSIIYVTAILLGMILGAVLSALVVPSLIYTSVLPEKITGSVPASQFYAVQSVPPIRIVIPTSLGTALGILIAICIVALGMMIYVVSLPSISQTLRLDED